MRAGERIGLPRRVRVPAFGWREPGVVEGVREAVVEVGGAVVRPPEGEVRGGVAGYDPVLRWHCRLDGATDEHG